MRTKLKLQLDQLNVDSFNTSTPRSEKGTVFGEQCTCYTECTCPGCPTCDATCAYTCDDASCGGTCDCTYEPGDTQYDYTCRNYGTCGRGPCQILP
jgi:hypothetical protein